MKAVLLVLLSLAIANSFHIGKTPFQRKSTLKMIEIQSDSTTYAAIFAATMIPSLLFVKFVGDRADSSRGEISDETREKFKKAMMEQPGQNFALPTNEEENLKRQIAKAYMQDKDVDVAVLEEKLRKRALWRKEMMQQAKAAADAVTEDEDGW